MKHIKYAVLGYGIIIDLDDLFHHLEDVHSNNDHILKLFIEWLDKHNLKYHYSNHIHHDIFITTEKFYKININNFEHVDISNILISLDEKLRIKTVCNNFFKSYECDHKITDKIKLILYSYVKV